MSTLLPLMLQGNWGNSFNSQTSSVQLAIHGVLSTWNPCCHSLAPLHPVVIAPLPPPSLRKWWYWTDASKDAFVVVSRTVVRVACCDHCTFQGVVHILSRWSSFKQLGSVIAGEKQESEWDLKRAHKLWQTGLEWSWIASVGTVENCRGWDWGGSVMLELNLLNFHCLETLKVHLQSFWDP